MMFLCLLDPDSESGAKHCFLELCKQNNKTYLCKVSSVDSSAPSSFSHVSALAFICNTKHTVFYISKSSKSNGSDDGMEGSGTARFSSSKFWCDLLKMNLFTTPALEEALKFGTSI
jgi:hypothetical protein